MKNLKELFEHHMKDLFSAENQLMNALPKVVENAKDGELKEAFQNYFEQTKLHKTKIEGLCQELGISPQGKKCKAMEGLIKETEGFIGEAQEDDVMDAGLIAEVQRVKHYEISGYGTAIRYAKELNLRDIAKNLQEILDEKYDADNKLDKLAEGRINEEAIRQ